MKLTTDEIEQIRKALRSIVLGSNVRHTVIRIPVSVFRARVESVTNEMQAIIPREPVIICKGVWWEYRDGRREMRWEIECTPVVSIHDRNNP